MHPASHSFAHIHRLTRWVCAVLTLTSLLILDLACVSRQSVRPRAVDLYIQGVKAYQSGDNERAISALATANELNPNLTMSRSLLGDLYRFKGDYQKAIREYEHTTQLDPYGARNYHNLGVAYQLTHRLQESTVAYLKALKLKPNDVETNMNLGLVYLSLSDSVNAEKYTGIAVGLAPDNPTALGNYAAALDAEGQHRLAESFYKKSLDIDPKQTSFVVNYASNLLKQRKYNEAVSVLRPVALETKEASIKKRFADALALSARHDEAILQYAEALKLDPKFFPAMNDMGRVLVAHYRSGLEMDEQMRKEAVNYWRASLTINPQQPKIMELVKRWEKTSP